MNLQNFKDQEKCSICAISAKQNNIADVDTDEYPLEYFEKQLYAKYLNAIFPDFYAENYEISDRLMEETQKFHNEFIQCTSAIQFYEYAMKELFSFALTEYLKGLLLTIAKLEGFENKFKVVKEFETMANKASNLINLNNNFRTIACLNAAKTR